jgi:hypothetical protein
VRFVVWVAKSSPQHGRRNSSSNSLLICDSPGRGGKSRRATEALFADLAAEQALGIGVGDVARLIGGKLRQPCPIPAHPIVFSIGSDPVDIGLVPSLSFDKRTQSSRGRAKQAAIAEAVKRIAVGQIVPNFSERGMAFAGQRNRTPMI